MLDRLNFCLLKEDIDDFFLHKVKLKLRFSILASVTFLILTFVTFVAYLYGITNRDQSVIEHLLLLDTLALAIITYFSIHRYQIYIEVINLYNNMFDHRLDIEAKKHNMMELIGILYVNDKKLLDILLRDKK